MSAAPREPGFDSGAVLTEAGGTVAAASDPAAARRRAASTTSNTATRSPSSEAAGSATGLAGPTTGVAAAVTAVERPRRPLWLRRSDQLVLGALVCVVVVLGSLSWARLSGWGLRPVEIDRLPARQYEYRLDLNHATWVEWMQLPGIGPTLARRIVAYREQNGPFESVGELDRVQGIGPKTIEKLRPWLLEPGLRDER